MIIHNPIQVFYSCASADQQLSQELEKHLSLLRQQGFISELCDRKILAGTNWKQAIDEYINTASIILLIISPDFLASNYHYGIEMQRALERQREEEGIFVIPIICRPVDLKGAPFANLQFLPRNAHPITLWTCQDDAWREVAQEIRRIIEQLQVETKPSALQKKQPSTLLSPASPSNSTICIGTVFHINQNVEIAEEEVIGLTSEGIPDAKEVTVKQKINKAQKKVIGVEIKNIGW